MMQPSLPPPAPAAPLFESPDVRVSVGDIRTKTGAYDPKAIDGVEFGKATVTTARVLRDLAWSATWALLMAIVLGPENLAAYLAGAMLVGPVGWWWAGQKHAAVILVRGARVELAVTDEATARRIGSAVIQAMTASGR